MRYQATLNRLIISILFVSLGLTACVPAPEPTPTPSVPTAEQAIPTPTPEPIPSETPTPTEQPVSVTPTAFPTLTLPEGPTPEAYGLPDWRVVEQALLEAAKLSGGSRGRCEWEVIGHDAAMNKVYLWVHCEAQLSGSGKSAMSGAMAVYLNSDGNIVSVYAPMAYGGEEFNREFPETIQRKFYDGSLVYNMQANLTLRERFPELPPQAAVAEGKYPMKPLSTLSPEVAKTERWVVYQSALAKAWYGTDKDIFCEWSYLGQIEEYVYLRPECEPFDRQQRKFWMPYCRLKIDDDGSISEVICKEKVDMGNGWGLDPAIFPLEIRQKSWADGTNSIFVDRIELRRWFQDLPPLIIEYGLELP